MKNVEKSLKVQEGINPLNRLKIIAHSDKIKAILRGDVPAPVRVVLEPCNPCNHRCPWCFYTDFRAKNRVMLSNEKLNELAEDFVEMGVKEVSIVGGGEPTAHPYIRPFMRQLHSSGISTTLTTNGGLLDEELRKIVCEGSTYIRIGLDSATDETHKKTHNPVKGSFDEVVENIKEIVKKREVTGSKVSIGIKQLIHDINVHEIEDMVKLAEDLGVDYVHFGSIRGEYYPPTSKGAKQKGDKILKELRKTAKIPLIGRLDRKDVENYITCMVTPLIAQISANGDQYICGFMNHSSGEFKIGNVNETRFRHSWGSEEHRNQLSKLKPDTCIGTPCKMKEYNAIVRDVFIDDKMHLNSI